MFERAFARGRIVACCLPLCTAVACAKEEPPDSDPHVGPDGGSGAARPDGGSGAAGPAQAGSCTGKQTKCEAPDVRVVTPSEVRTCNVRKVGAASIRWSVDLGDMECPVGRCIMTEPELAIAGDGSFWVVGELRPSDPGSLDVVIGSGIKHFGPQGEELAAAVLSLRGRFDTHKRADTDGMRAAPTGDLLMVAPSTGEIPIELVAIGADARPVARSPLVDRAQLAAGSIGGDDRSVVLAYVYKAESEGGVSEQYFNLAAFDATGRVRWNQNLGTALAIRAPAFASSLLQGMAVQVLGADGGESVVGISNAFFDGAYHGDLLARFDAKGNTRWVRELPETYKSRAWAQPDGGIVLSHVTDEDDLMMEEIDAAGVAGPRTILPWTSARVTAVGVDGRGRVLLSGTIPPGEAAPAVRTLGIFSREGAVCALSSLEALSAVIGEDVPRFLGPEGGGSGMYFATGRVVGILEVPEAP